MMYLFIWLFAISTPPLMRCLLRSSSHFSLQELSSVLEAKVRNKEENVGLCSPSLTHKKRELAHFLIWSSDVLLLRVLSVFWGFPGNSDGKESACNARLPGSRQQPFIRYAFGKDFLLVCILFFYSVIGLCRAEVLYFNEVEIRKIFRHRSYLWCCI